MSELADEIERLANAVTNAPTGPDRVNEWGRLSALVRGNLPAILQALRDGEKMREALKVARSGINAAYALAQAEYHNHDRVAERHDKTVNAAYAAIAQALTGEGHG